jgi:hypothetical protein
VERAGFDVEPPVVIFDVQEHPARKLRQQPLQIGAAGCEREDHRARGEARAIQRR